VSAGPGVRATSSPVAICFSQILERPSRTDTKATMRPSADAVGRESVPLWVNEETRGGSAGGVERRVRSRTPIRSAPRNNPATQGMARHAGGAGAARAVRLMRAPSANAYRDTWCGSLDATRTGDEVRVAGWVHRRRDHGGLHLIDLPDPNGPGPPRGSGHR